MKDSAGAAIGRAIRTVVSGETEADRERRQAGEGLRAERLAGLGFTEHRWTEPFAFVICATCRAWLRPDDDDMKQHHDFHRQLEKPAG